jgi:hypothetical protein
MNSIKNANASANAKSHLQATTEATEIDDRELASVTGGAPMLDIPDSSLEDQQSLQAFLYKFRV